MLLCRSILWSLAHWVPGIATEEILLSSQLNWGTFSNHNAISIVNLFL